MHTKRDGNKKKEHTTGKDPRTEQLINTAKEGTKNQNGPLACETKGKNQTQREHADQEYGALLNQIQRLYVQDMHFPN